MKKPRCYNCKHASEQFKIGKLTHLHCLKDKQSGTSPWETLRVFSDGCDKHDFKKL